MAESSTHLAETVTATTATTTSSGGLGDAPAALLMPVGTVTLLFTDIEGSTRRWEADEAAMRAALARHDAILRTAIAAHGGYVFKTVGDAFYATFATAPDALAAAAAAQRALATEEWAALGMPEPLRVRLALHTGAVQVRDGDYFGPPLNRVARLLAAGHGGQTLLSLPAVELVRDALPEGASLHDLGDHRLKDLLRPEHVFQLDLPALPARFPSLRTLDSRPHNLPAQATPFIGRERELEAIPQRLLLPEVRLLTLHGPGGTGKTRLSLQAAANCLDAFADGVFFVPLDALHDPAPVPAAVARALALKEQPEQPAIDTLTAYLREKQLLLVLDNFEQVMGAAPLVSDLLAVCPQLKVLATSRALLRIYGEYGFPVPPLALPDPKRLPPAAQLAQYEAVRLFVERAQAVRPDFAVTSANAATLAEICCRLEGLPLAIELAAARVRLLPPQAILSRLERRLPLLAGGARDLPARQQTLRNAIAWSYDLLEPAEQRLFRRLSVFASGWTFEAAEAVCSATGDLVVDMLDVLESLVDKSLVQRHEQAEADDEPRFRMLETIREFAREQLAASGESEALQQQHAAYFLALAEEAEPQLDQWAGGPAQQAWLDRIEADLDNFRAALRWAVERVQASGGDPVAAEQGLRLVEALRMVWLRRGYLAEARQWLDTLLGLAGTQPTPQRARSLQQAASIARTIGEMHTARARWEESLAVARALDDPRKLAVALERLADQLFELDEVDAAQRCVEEELELYRVLDDQPGIVRALISLGRAARRRGDSATAQRRTEESLALARESGGDWQSIAYALSILSRLAEDRSDFETARARREEALALARQAGSTSGVSNALYSLGRIARQQGDYATARQRYEEGLAAARETNDRISVAETLEQLGLMALQQDLFEEARLRFEEAHELYRAAGDRMGTAAALGLLGRVAGAEGDWAEVRRRYEEALPIWREIRNVSSEARALLGLGIAAAEQADFAAAGVHLRQSLALRQQRSGVAETLDGFAHLATRMGQPESALRLCGAAAALRKAAGVTTQHLWPAKQATRLDQARQALDAASATAAEAAGWALTRDEAIAYALETVTPA